MQAELRQALDVCEAEVLSFIAPLEQVGPQWRNQSRVEWDAGQARGGQARQPVLLCATP